ncbi:MAG: periplasmic heavy metal sensor [Pseudomonadota bacterium]
MADQSPSRPSRLWRVILVISLALNLAVAGLFVGAVASGRWKDGPPAHFEIGLGPVGRALAPDERRDIRRALIRQRALRDLNLRGGMSDIVAALQTEPFDAAVMQDVMTAQMERTTDLQQIVQTTLLAVIDDMTPERRAAFAEQLLQEMSKVRSERERPSGG